LPGFLSMSSFDEQQVFADSAWREHAPFVFHLISTLRPRTLVELGTHQGFSFFAFCQAIQKYSPGTLAYAIGAWEDDAHSGPDHEGAVFEARTKHNFADGSIDLLHIDGEYKYEKIREDFESWRAKLTPNAIVLLHNTLVREPMFGSWRYFEELGRV